MERRRGIEASSMAEVVRKGRFQGRICAQLFGGLKNTSIGSRTWFFFA